MAKTRDCFDYQLVRQARPCFHLQLRFLGTLTEIAAEKNSTIIFPLALELLKAFTYDTSQEKK